ncbi:fungal-specific transcription factor domain-containing protein [Xylogone sp. PMI_703]|nr:fungal-specific transcription factor domain-containing protein [Xylogone sp. PMI_703]
MSLPDTSGEEKSMSLSDTTGEEKSVSLVTRACDMCRKKKIRCDIVSDVCAQCIKYKTKCHFTPISVKRSRRSIGKKRVEELEKKLKWMEEQLKLALENRSSAASDASSSHRSLSLATPSSNQSGASMLDFNFNEDGWDSAFPAVGEHALLPDLSLPFQTSKTSSPRAMSIDFRADTLQIAFPNTVLNSEIAAIPNFVNEFSSRAFKPLPPRDKMLALIKKSFGNFYSAYPLFDEHAFLSAFDSTDMHLHDPSWWACLNVVLAMTYRFCDANSLDPEADGREAWEYFQNALAVINQLMTTQFTLWSVQALLGMALLIQGTPNQGPVSLLTASAIKLAQRIGLHRQSQDPSRSAAEIEERKLVFWIGYCLDKDVTLQTRQPPAQDDDDMDVELPSKYGVSPTRPGESINMGIFYFRVKLAIIQGQIYKRLFSAKTVKQTVDERISAARELQNMLQTWRASVPAEYITDYYRPSYPIPASNGIRRPVILQLAYFTSLSVIYDTLPALPMYREIPAPGDPVDMQVMSAALVQTTEARKAIKLLQVLPTRENACLWSVLHTFISAATTLLINSLTDPSNPLALSDLALIEPLLRMLEMLSKTGQSEKASNFYRSCFDLYEKAKMAAEGYNSMDAEWGQLMVSAQQSRRDGVEEFLRSLGDISPGYDVGMGSIDPGLSREIALALGDQFDELMQAP